LEIIIIYLLIQIPLAIEAGRRVPLITASMLVMFYLIGAELIYLGARTGILPLTIMLPGVRPGVFQTGPLFPVCLGLIFSAAYLSTTNMRFKMNSVGTLSPRLSLFIEISCVAIGLTWASINLLSEDSAVLWKNSTYLAMTTPKNLSWDPVIFGPFLQTMQLVGVLVGAVMILTLRRGHIWMAGALAVPFAYIFLFYLCGHSRVAGVQVAAVAVMLLTSRGRWFKVAGVVVSGMVGFVWAAVLEGRSMGEHGFASFSDTLGIVFSRWDGGQEFLTVISNFFEGIFTLAYSSLMDLQYPTNYKVLSFSPLFSFMDKFDAIRDADQIRVNIYIPVCGYAEAYAFGPVYLGLMILTLFFVLRSANVIAEKQSGLVSQMVNFLVAMSIILLFAYNVRNGYRLIIYSEFLCLFLIAQPTIRRFVANNRRRRHAPPLRFPNAPLSGAVGGDTVLSSKDRS